MITFLVGARYIVPFLQPLPDRQRRGMIQQTALGSASCSGASLDACLLPWRAFRVRVATLAFGGRSFSSGIKTLFLPALAAKELALSPPIKTYTTLLENGVCYQYGQNKH